MFIQKIFKKVGEKTYCSTLLLKKYRVGKKVRHHTILNLSRWTPEQISALNAALKGGTLVNLNDVQTEEGKSIGALWVFKELAAQCALLKALGGGRKGKLALLLVMGRLLTQGSRLHLCEWGKNQEIEKVIGVSKYTEDDLYEALDWLADTQREIEKKLFGIHYKGNPPRLFLYDVTSSYLEGTHNEFSEYGYNRDGKRGKKQVVIGLMTDGEGRPITVEVFKGNTRDIKTVFSQIKKLALDFHVKEVVFVGDRGMLKSEQIAQIEEEGFFYITAITKPEIEVLLRSGDLQMSLFDKEIAEGMVEGIRYILRKNPDRAEEMAANRREKLEKLRKRACTLSVKLRDHPRCKATTALQDLKNLADRLKISEWVHISEEGRAMAVSVDEDRLKGISKLDGCYAIKTNMGNDGISAQDVHDRYKDLAFVEQAFRTIKTGYLEIRPIYVRKGSRTKGHVFVTMLAYLLIWEFWKRTKHLGSPLESMIDSLDKINTTILTLEKNTIKQIPKPSKDKKAILDALNISLPKNL